MSRPTTSGSLDPCADEPGAKVAPGSFLREHLFERCKQAECGFARLPVEPTQPLRKPRNHREVGRAILEDGAGAAGGAEEVDGDRGLVREATEKLHLVKGEALVRPIEHLEHAEGTLLVEERDGHDPARNVARRLGKLAREARIRGDIVDHERLARDEHPTGEAGARGDSSAHQLIAFARDGFEDELVPLLVQKEDGCGPRRKDRARDLDDRAQERDVLLFCAQDAGRDYGAKILPAQLSPPTFVAVR
jgi:hypothetical protein